MIINLLMKYDPAINETQVIDVYKNYDKAMEDAKKLAEDIVKGCSFTKSISEFDDRIIVYWNEEDDGYYELGDNDIATVFYVMKKETK